MERQDTHEAGQPELSSMEALSALAGEVAAADAEAQPKVAEPSNTEADGAGGQHQAQPSSPPADPLDDARALVSLLAFGVERIFEPIKYTEETKTKGAEVLAPLLVKYGVKETIFGRWEEEFKAGMFFGGVIMASVQVYKAAKAGDAEAQAANKKSWFAKLFSWSK